MANRWLVQKLIASAKRRGFIVVSDDPLDGFSEDDFLDLIDDIIRSRMVPLLKRTRESYLVTEEDLSLTSGRASYPLPSRAAAETLRSILIEGDSGAWPPLDRIEPEEAHARTATDGTPNAYYLRDDNAVFVPTPGAGQSVRFLYFSRPNLVVPATEVCEVESVDFNANSVTVAAWDQDTEEFETAATGIPEDFVVGGLFDLVRGVPGFRNHAYDLTVASITGAGPFVITFEEELPEGLAAGDFVCLTGESPIAQIPAELHPMLAHEVTRTLLEAKGDSKADRAAKTVERLEEDAKSMLSPRVTEAPKYIQNYNAPGWSRMRRWRPR